MDETPENDPDWITDPVEKLPKEKGEYKLTLFMSTDGKHTVSVVVDAPDSRKDAILAAEKLYDYIKFKYGTKQAQAVKEYSSPPPGSDPASWCPIHRVMMKKYTKDNHSWYSHKNGDEWCNPNKKKNE